jgi:hypothetical protein
MTPTPISRSAGDYTGHGMVFTPTAPSSRNDTSRTSPNSYSKRNQKMSKTTIGAVAAAIASAPLLAIAAPMTVAHAYVCDQVQPKWGLAWSKCMQAAAAAAGAPPPVYISPAQIPASCQQYVGPDANGNDQNGVLQLCIKTHQLTGN